MTAQEQLIATAQAQVGYLGKKSAAQLDDLTANAGGKYNKFARDMDALKDFYNGAKQGFDWCDVFVDWCFVETFGRELAQKLLNQPDKSLGAGTGYSLNYYKAKGRFFTSPQPGDQIFFGSASTTDHTGIVAAVDGGCVHTIEGNAGSPTGVHGFKYPVGYSYIKGYGRPDFSLVPEGQKEPAAPAATPEVYRTLADVPDWARPTVQKLLASGALQGTGNGEINVSRDLCRTLVILDRTGKL